VRPADLVLLVANLVYATSYVVTRVALDHLPPAFLALGRLAIAAAVLWPIVRTLDASATAPGRGDAWRIVAMGAVGFAGAYACSHWGLARSTATNAALLIVVEPVSIMLLSPPLLGERLRRREAVGATVALLGVVIVVLDGVPGLTRALAPALARRPPPRGGRRRLRRLHADRARRASPAPPARGHGALDRVGGGGHGAPGRGRVARRRAAGTEPRCRRRPDLPRGGHHGPGLSRVELGAGPGERAPASIFLTVQPIGGAVLAVVLLGEPLTMSTVAGAVLLALGLWVTVAGNR
jgi:uncharacterized membrane protein